MTKKNIQKLESIGIDIYCIDDLAKRVEKYHDGVDERYNLGFYNGYICSLYDFGMINVIEYEELSSEVEEP
jgi:hypothetical protein